MSSIYIHIPFCKQACHYCDFHFSTSLKKKDEMVSALVREIELRSREMQGERIETIYFGGGTPSILSVEALDRIIRTVQSHFEVVSGPEITLEANPDDLTSSVFREYRSIGINRLSLGVQSFYEEDLKMMNRAHNAVEARACIAEAVRYFENITIDLIYGIPGMSNERWRNNIQTALNFGIPHISSYALTVEPKTALKKFIEKGLIPNVDDAVAHDHFLILIEELSNNGFIHYELSNFGKEGFFSKANTAYWLGKKYLGIGPSAHSFDGLHRSWNIANNSKYIASIIKGDLPSEVETLTTTDRYNEYIMTGLRTIWGVDTNRVAAEFGSEYLDYLMKQAERPLYDGLLYLNQQNGVLTVSSKGKFLMDGIASDLFLLNLS